LALKRSRGEKTINEIGQEHGVHPAQVGQWKRAIQEQAQSLFEGKKRGPQPAAGHQEPEKLFSEIGNRLSGNEGASNDMQTHSPNRKTALLLIALRKPLLH